jgi:hypothetical protein
MYTTTASPIYTGEAIEYFDDKTAAENRLAELIDTIGFDSSEQTEKWVIIPAVLSYKSLKEEN